jgi:hypothetical protein
MTKVLFGALMFLGLATLPAQERTTNPPFPSANPYVARGDPRSPDGKLEWRIKTTDPVGYELVETASSKTLLTVPAALADAGGEPALRYARAYGVYWNKTGDLVVLDELNFRRAGKIYFYRVQDGQATELLVTQKIPRPAGADEARICADKGWLSPQQFSLRQAVKFRGGEAKSLYYIVDLADAAHPQIRRGR